MKKTKHKKYLEAQKMKTQNAKKLIVCCVSRSDNGKEVFTKVVGKNGISWEVVSEYANETDQTDFKILDRENFFEYAEALHCYLTLNHDGQNSELYALLGRSQFTPGPLWSETRVELENSVYGEVSGLDLEELERLMDELETLTEETENENHCYIVSLYEINRKALYGDKNTEGLRDFRGHSSHFLVEHGKELDLGDFV